jgi:hypothetical protein
MKFDSIYFVRARINMIAAKTHGLDSTSGIGLSNGRKISGRSSNIDPEEFAR